MKENLKEEMVSTVDCECDTTDTNSSLEKVSTDIISEYSENANEKSTSQASTGLGYFEALEQEIFSDEVKFIYKDNKTISLKRPDSTKFFRVNEDQACKGYFIMASDSFDREKPYYLTKNMAKKYKGILPIKEFVCFPYLTHDLKYGIWLLSKRSGTWFSTALEAIKLSREKWVRIQATDCRAYNYFYPENDPDINVQWLEGTVEDIIQTYCPDQFIENDTHPIICQLLGRKVQGAE